MPVTEALYVLKVRHDRPEWRVTLAKPEMAHGGFGENFTVAGLSEADVCVGDRFMAGDALLQISQPRGPYWKLARRNRRPRQTTCVASA